MGKIPDNSAQMAEIARDISTELNAGEVLGKIDWQKVIALVVELLPLILAFFAEQIDEK